MSFTFLRRTFSWSRIWARVPLFCAFVAMALSVWVAISVSAPPAVTTGPTEPTPHRLQREWAIWMARTQPHTQATFRAQNLIVDELVRNDTETFFSCGGTPLDNVDLWAAAPHNSRVEIDMTATHCTINGIVAGSEGDLLWLWNGGGGTGIPFTITLNNAASGTPINNIWIADGKALNIPNNDGVLLIYDGGFGWTVFGGATSSIRAAEFSYDPNVAPAALASGSAYNNYNPWAGGSVTSFIKQNVSGSGTATLTGLLAAGAPNSDGRVVVIKNVSGSGTIAFTCKDGASSADNQFACPNGSAFSIAHDESATLLYDDTVNFYTVLALGKAIVSPGTGTVTSVGSGSGTFGGPITTTGNIAIDPTYTQRRVSGSCASPNALISINQDGTVSCSTGVGTGTVTSVGSGSGISGGPITTAGNLAIDPTYTQRRVSGTCTAPNAVGTVNQDGTVTCANGGAIATGSLSVTVNADPGGTINLSTAGTVSWIYNNSGSTTKPTATTPTATYRWKQLDNGLAQFLQVVAISNTTSVGNYTQGTSFTTTSTDDIFGTSMAGSNGGTIYANAASGVNFGWMLHFPVNIVARTIKMYVIVHGGTATVTAHLEDASAVDATNTFTAASGSNVTKEVDVLETAGSSTYLDIKVILTSSAGVGEVGFSAITEQ